MGIGTRIVRTRLLYYKFINLCSMDYNYIYTTIFKRGEGKNKYLYLYTKFNVFTTRSRITAVPVTW